MLDTLLQDREDELAGKRPSALSHSRVNRYLTCPEQYRLHYIENLRLRIPRANLVFGQVIHQSLAGLFLRTEDPLKHFGDTWSMVEKVALTYGERDSWAKLKDSGRGMLEKFVSEEFPKIGDISGVEQPFELTITGLDVPLVGIIDLQAAVQGLRTIVDFKTAAATYEPHEAAMSDQLTTYSLAAPGAEQLALCVLVKTKTPRVEWHLTKRPPEHVREYLAKLGFVAREIRAHRFYKRHGMWCSWCDFLPVCLGDRARADDTLFRLQA